VNTLVDVVLVYVKYMNLHLMYSSLPLCVSDGPVDNWRKILELNVLALSVCTKEAIQSMKERSVDDGHIIHMNRFVGPTNAFRSLLLHTAFPSRYGVTGCR